jgi:hypothetical protein
MLVASIEVDRAVRANIERVSASVGNTTVPEYTGSGMTEAGVAERT